MKLSKHTLNLRAGDMDALRTAFPHKGGSVIIRALVSKFVDKQLNKPLTQDELKGLAE